jgi:TP901 family phage tail tape measure protein
MSDRSVSVLLKADVSSFIAGIEKAKLATRDLASDASKSAATHKESWDKVGKGMMLTGGVILAGVGLATKSFMDFDQSMSRAQAGTMATGAELAALRTAAIDAGAATQFSATEAADAITAMGKAGVSTKDILGGGLNGALSLAAAGELDVASASEIAATAMNQFGLQGKDIPHVADLLAAGAGKAMGSVEDLAGALKFVGPVAKGLGVSIEQTTGTLALFAQQGIIGEMAGTSMRGMLLSLTSPSKIAKGAMDDLGITVYDAQGKFVGLDGVAGQLHDKLGPLSEATRNQALGQIFGNEQVTAARVLYDGGAAAVQDWTNKVNDAGFAARQAAMLTDNLKGDIERLGGSLSSVLIESGSATNGMLRTMTQELQGVVDLYGSMPTQVQQGATVLGSVAGAATLVTGGLIALAPRIAATKVALADMGKTGALLSRGLSGVGSTLMGPVGIALAAGVIGLGYYAKQAQESKGRVDELTNTLDTQTGAITENTRAWTTKRLSESGILELAKKMGISLTDVTDAAMGNADATARASDALDAYGAAAMKASGVASLNATENGEAAANMRELGGAVRGNAAETARAVTAQKLLAEANDAGGTAAAAAADKTGGLTGAQQALKTATDDAKKALDDEVASMQSAGLVVLSTRDARRQMIEAINAGSDAVKKNGQTLDINTQKGRDNQVALDGVAGKALSLADSIYKETGSEEAMRASLVTSRASLVTAAQHFGMTKDQANKYADSVLKIPAAASTTVNANTAPASAKLAALQRQLDAATADRSVNIRYYVTTSGKAPALAGSAKSVFNVSTGATGGYITGPGTGTSDSIPAMLSTGEFIIRAASVKKVGTAALHQINSYADGGVVARSPRYVSAPARSMSASGGSIGGGSSSVNVAAPQVHVYVDGQEFRGMVRVEVDSHTQALTDALVYGGH